MNTPANKPSSPGFHARSPGLNVLNKAALHTVSAAVSGASLTSVLDGITAVSYVSYALSDSILLSAENPSGYMGELALSWHSSEAHNCAGQAPSTRRLREVELPGALREAAQGSGVVSTLCVAQGHAVLQSCLHQLVHERRACVMHLVAGPTLTGSRSVFGDHTALMSYRNTGALLLSSHSVQQCHDLGLVAHLLAKRRSLPVVHFLDGLRTSHELNQADLLTHARLAQLAAEFDAQDDSSTLDVPDSVEHVMDALAPTLGCNYGLFGYVGAQDAECVVVVMGSAGTVVQEAVKVLCAAGHSVGAIMVHLYRPWSHKHLSLLHISEPTRPY
eukprot:TRINITY_DN10381_c0_g2_i1.p1 TRINITY_DN10381_c0_g2~~TRINITY_DN10381_c0_g2_i1.p1  ORF type:complete len:331 (-),score=83.43 TRINITY_DN10381_c0_g2_i1:60-1052(-)